MGGEEGGLFILSTFDGGRGGGLIYFKHVWWGERRGGLFILSTFDGGGGGEEGGLFISSTFDGGRGGGLIFFIDDNGIDSPRRTWTLRGKAQITEVGSHAVEDP